MEWISTTLSDACVIKPPKKEAKEMLAVSDMVSFVPMENLGVCKKEIYLSQDRELENVAGSYTYFADGDVLLAKITPCFENGKLGIAQGLTNGIGFGSSEYIVFRCKDGLTSEYLFYFLSRDEFRRSGAKVMSGAVGHKRVPKEFIENTAIRIPPLPEQKRIVAILDEVFAGIDKAIANTEKNLANARELFESHLNAVFQQKGDGWEEKKLGDVCNLIGGGTPSKRNPDYYNGDIPWATVRDMNQDVISDTDCQITMAAVKASSTNIIPAGNVVIATRVGLGKVCLLEHDTAINQDLRGIVPFKSDSLSSRFLFWWLRSIASVIEKEGTGATVKGVKLPFVKSLKISFPDWNEQKLTVSLLDSLRQETQRLEEINQKKLTALAELKQSILQKAFSGELTANPEKELKVAV